MSENQEFRFNLGDAYPHDRFPMKRLSEYLKEITELFGEEEHVYFTRLEEGSTILVARTEPAFAPMVGDNLQAIVRGDAPYHRIAAFHTVNRMLREDHSDGYIIDPDERKVIEFPGIKKDAEPEPEVEPVFGPVSQYEKFDGVPVWVGGEKELKRVALKERGGRVRRIDADASLASKIAVHLWTDTVRVEGTAKWLRQENGKWTMKQFRASEFSVLPDISLDEDIAVLRAFPAKWKEREDPLGDLDIIRHEDDIQ